MFVILAKAIKRYVTLIVLESQVVIITTKKVGI